MSNTSSTRIFISYRRADTAEYADRLSHALTSRYGRDSVFLDIDAIEPGVSLEAAISQAVDTCEVMLVVVGRNWTGRRDQRGPRLYDQKDLVRVEIERALQSDKWVIPVLVGGAQLPSQDELPPDLVGLVNRQAIKLDDSSWARDVEELCRGIERLTKLRPRERIGRQVAPAPERSLPPPAETQPGAQVFVSHADEDVAFVKTIVANLEGKGFRCWVSYRDIPAGERSWAGFIVGAIAKSQLMVIVLTKNAVTSKQVLREVTIADDENIAFIPFKVDEAPLSNDLKYFFSTAQRLDTGGLDPATALELLTTAVQNRLQA